LSEIIIKKIVCAWFRVLVSKYVLTVYSQISCLANAAITLDPFFQK